MFAVFAVAAGLAALFHVLFFAMEALLFMRPATYRRFGVTSAEEAETLRPVMVNQGFYNLFLACGLVAGIVLANSGRCALAYFCCAFAVACAVVLIATKREMWRPALLQGAPPLVAAIALFLANH